MYFLTPEFEAFLQVRPLFFKEKKKRTPRSFSFCNEIFLNDVSRTTKRIFWRCHKRAKLSDQNRDRPGGCERIRIASSATISFSFFDPFLLYFFFLEQKRKKAERTFFQLWERLDGRGGFVWEQNVGWEVL